MTEQSIYLSFCFAFCVSCFAIQMIFSSRGALYIVLSRDFCDDTSVRSIIQTAAHSSSSSSMTGIYQTSESGRSKSNRVQVSSVGTLMLDIRFTQKATVIVSVLYHQFHEPLHLTDLFVDDYLMIIHHRQDSVFYTKRHEPNRCTRCTSAIDTPIDTNPSAAVHHPSVN